MYRRFEVESTAPGDEPAECADKDKSDSSIMDADVVVEEAEGVTSPTLSLPAQADEAPIAAETTDMQKSAPGGDQADSDQQDGAAEEEDEEDNTVYEIRRLDQSSADVNEWTEGNVSPILSGGGSVDAMTGGLVSTAADYSRLCLMLLRKGELDGVRILRRDTIEMLTTNQLPRATGRDDVWAFGTPGVGFGLLGSVSVDHPELDSALRAAEYGWGGMAGTAWTNDPNEDFFLLSFSLTAFDLTTEEELRAGVRAAIESFDKKKQEEEERRRTIELREQTERAALAAADRESSSRHPPIIACGADEDRASTTPPKKRRGPSLTSTTPGSTSSDEQQRKQKKRRPHVLHLQLSPPKMQRIPVPPPQLSSSKEDEDEYEAKAALDSSTGC